MVCRRMEEAPWLSFLGGGGFVRLGFLGVKEYIREKGRFAAVWVTEEEDCACWCVVHK